MPNIKRLTIKSVPEVHTAGDAEEGEADFAAAMQGEIAEDVKRDPTDLWWTPCVHVLDRSRAVGSKIPVGR